MRSIGVGYFLWLFCIIGLCGVHRIYAGKYISGVIWILTFGIFGIGQLIDLFLIPSHIDRANDEYHARQYYLNQYLARHNNPVFAG